MRRALVPSSKAEAPAAPAAPSRPVLRLGGLDVAWRVSLGRIRCAAVRDGRLAAATDDGAVVFLDAGGAVAARSAPVEDSEANDVALGADGSWAVACYDDGYARVASARDGALLLEHAVAAPAAAGKRQRRVAATRVLALPRNRFAAAAGRLVHAVDARSGALAHAVACDAPVRGLCAAPPAVQSWAYGCSHGGGVVLVADDGSVAARLASARPLRALAASATWLAAATFDGAVELWDAAAPGGEPDGAVALRSSCGCDGAHCAWSGLGDLAVSGARAAVFDFSGDAPHHPYRRGPAPAPGEPDPVPRVCMAEGPAVRVAWGPGGALATAAADGVVRVWRPRGRLRKGGQGRADRPETMRPQFFAFPKRDAAHPSGDAAAPAALAWLGDGTVAACYEAGDVVAWRLPEEAAPAQ